MSRSEHLASRRLCERQEDSEDQLDVRAVSAAWCGRMSVNNGIEILPKATTSALPSGCVDVQILTHTNEMLDPGSSETTRTGPVRHGSRREEVLPLSAGGGGGGGLLHAWVTGGGGAVEDGGGGCILLGARFSDHGTSFNASMAGDIIMMLNLVEPRLPLRVPPGVLLKRAAAEGSDGDPDGDLMDLRRRSVGSASEFEELCPASAPSGGERLVRSFRASEGYRWKRVMLNNSMSSVPADRSVSFVARQDELDGGARWLTARKCKAQLLSWWPHSRHVVREPGETGGGEMGDGDL